MAGEGVSFQVVDVDTFSHNEVVGRCFWSATDMQKAMKSNTPKVLSLGEGCAIRLHHRPVRTILLRPCPAVLRSVGELKVLVHGPYKSSYNAGMLDEKGSSNEQALAKSRTAATTVPAPQTLRRSATWTGR
eukprot:scaffold110734_cov75-Phaeocystis_antarctica.AAC.6